MRSEQRAAVTEAEDDHDVDDDALAAQTMEDETDENETMADFGDNRSGASLEANDEFVAESVVDEMDEGRLIQSTGGIT